MNQLGDSMNKLGDIMNQLDDIMNQLGKRFFNIMKVTACREIRAELSNQHAPQHAPHEKKT